MPRYIDAEGLNLYDNLFMSEDTINKSGVYVRYRTVENLIKNAPTADVQEIKHGRWIDIDKGHFTSECSCCGAYVCNGLLYSTHLRYCPNCGAKMDEKDGE